MAPPLAPPAIRYSLAPPAALAAGCGLLWLLAVALLLGWAWQPQAGAARQLAALAMALGAGAGLRQGWRALGRGLLAWDGAQWWLHAQDARQTVLAVSLQVRADGGGWLWVQARPAAAAGSRWLLLSASHSPQAWGELRRAVYFPARLPEPPQ